MQSLSERVKARVVALYRERRFTQAALAKALSVDPSAANGYVSGGTRISLDVLEAVSDVSGVPLAELVVPDGSLLRQLNATEAQLFRALRQWPQSVTEALTLFLAFFADEPAIDRQTRNVHEMWRQIRTPADRNFLEGALQMLNDGRLAPDLKEALARQLEDDRLKRVTVRARQTTAKRRGDGE
jgi:transcriptional regulator with XRE-family HTH domain